jgi:poly(3-hydroxybutyrate) depolymerase
MGHSNGGFMSFRMACEPADVVAAIGRGELHPVEPVSYPMSRAADAMRDMQGRAVAGKVALVPDFA